MKYMHYSLRHRTLSRLRQSLVDLDRCSEPELQRLDVNRQRWPREEMLIQHEGLIKRLQLTLRARQLPDLLTRFRIAGSIAARCNALDLIEPCSSRQTHGRPEVPAPVDLVIVDSQVRRVPVRILLDLHHEAEQCAALLGGRFQVKVAPRVSHLISGAARFGDL